MKEWYKLLLAAVDVLIPIVVLGWGNTFGSGRETFLRAAVAVVLSWAWLVASALAVTRIDLALATTQADIDSVVIGDGARHTGALFLGWLPSIVSVVLCWAALRALRALRGQNGTLRD